MKKSSVHINDERRRDTSDDRRRDTSGDRRRDTSDDRRGATIDEEQRQPTSNQGTAWCIGFQKRQGQQITILGDLVLKDKIVVYDVAGQRIGWANYDCSSSVNVSTTTSNGQSESVNAGQIGHSSSSRNTPSFKLIPSIVIAFPLHISAIATSFSFL